MPACHTHQFKRDDGRTIEIECDLASEGRGLGIYVDQDYLPDGEPKLSDDEATRLNEEVAESEEALASYEDYLMGYDD